MVGNRDSGQSLADAESRVVRAVRFEPDNVALLFLQGRVTTEAHFCR